jgi:hypothetical protein
VGRHGDRVVRRTWAYRNSLLQFEVRLADLATGATACLTSRRSTKFQEAVLIAASVQSLATQPNKSTR